MNISIGDILALLTWVATVLGYAWKEAQRRQETNDWRSNVTARLEKIEAALIRSQTL
jgi:hypothetical protein